MERKLQFRFSDGRTLSIHFPLHIPVVLRDHDPTTIEFIFEENDIQRILTFYNTSENALIAARRADVEVVDTRLVPGPAGMLRVLINATEHIELSHIGINYTGITPDPELLLTVSEMLDAVRNACK